MAIAPTVDVPGNTRAALARKRLRASDLIRTFGGTPAYWSSRLNGHKTLDSRDMECVALICQIHPAELLGGAPPEGWTPPPCPEGDSNAWPTPYKAKGSPLALVGLAA